MTKTLPNRRRGPHATGLVVASLLVVFSVPACQEDTPAAPPGRTSCTTSSDCDVGEICDGGLCATLCAGDGDCGPAEACDNGVCVPGSGDCATAADCTTPPTPCQVTPGECIGGTCRFAPAADSVLCEDGDVCTLDDHCNGLGGCTGEPRVCGDPPAPECSGGSLTLYDELGVCVSGAGCDYPTTSFACDGDCIDCMAACCLLRGCPQGDDASTACVVEGGCDTTTCECFNTLDPVATACDDTDPCTVTDVCQACSAGTPGCIAGRLCDGAPAACDAPPVCHEAAGTCRPSCAGATGSCVSCSAPDCNWVCDYVAVADGPLCDTGLGSGVCVAGACTAGYCSIGGQVVASGTANTSNGCEVCDPTQSQTTWSTIACASDAGGECRQAAGSCDPLAAGGCFGQACCVYAAIWDGSGSAPSCGATGVCDTTGACVGCTSGLDCDDGNLCTTDTCDANTCNNQTLSSGVCDVVAAGDGMCIAGICKLVDGQTCTFGADCASGSCESSLCCPVGADCCESDASCNGEWACDVAVSTCYTGCSGSAQCQASGYCDGTSCAGDKANGSLCVSPDECLSGTCESGVCCSGGVDCCQADADCQGTVACDTAARICPTTCAANDDSQCKVGHHCDGGSCDLDLTQGSACDEASDCEADRCESLVCCAGSADCCITGSDCAGLWDCNSSSNICYDACSSDGECKLTAYCDGTAACTAALTNGDGCSRDRQCQSGRCDSSLCCGVGNDCCSSDVDCDGNFACDVPSGICYDTCATEAECKAGLTCINGACGTGAPNGTVCTVGNECVSGRCDAGFCCAAGDECCADDSDCPGENSCDTGPNVCRTSCGTDIQCKATGWCSGTSCVADLALTNACARDQQCSSDACESGVCCGASADCCLTGDSECTSPTYGCDTAARTCNTTCGLNGDCKSTAWCNVAACVAKSANGTGCTDGFECTSTRCVDDTCCNSACTGTCRACDVVGSVGSCTNVPDGDDLDDECSLATCMTGDCNGAGACGAEAANASCGTCKVCDGGGSCDNAAAGSDPNTQCSAFGCKTGDCDGAGACANDPNGSACTTGECFGSCQDGICEDNCSSGVCCFPGCCASSYMRCGIECGPPP